LCSAYEVARGNATCVSFATTDFVNDGRIGRYRAPGARDDTVLRGSGRTVNIDYSDILPGDDAPDPDDPAAQKPVAVPAASTGASGTHAALTQAGARTSGANVVVLSADPALIDLLRGAVAGHHRVWRADDPAHATDLRVSSGNAVLLIDAALALSMFVLLEAFDAPDIELAHALTDSRRAHRALLLVGINSRDLVTLKVVPGRLDSLASLLPAGVKRVAESGVATAADAARMAACGYDLALVGSALMSAADPAQLAGDMLAQARAAVKTRAGLRSNA
jgi:hypothetical protein